MIVSNGVLVVEGIRSASPTSGKESIFVDTKGNRLYIVSKSIVLNSIYWHEANRRHL